MAPTQGRNEGEVTLEALKASIANGPKTKRQTALDDLIYFFSKPQPTPLLDRDKTYHSIFEALFTCALSERGDYFSGRKTTKSTATTRLGKCAEALRTVLTYGASKIRRKTANAVIKHITQVLPSSDEGYVRPLTQDYIKSLVILLGQPAIVESLATKEGEGWHLCIGFVVEVITWCLDGNDKDVASLSRASPAPGTGQTLSLPYSSGRSGILPSQRVSGQHTRTLHDLLQCLVYLTSCSNAPLLEQGTEITSAVLRVLQTRHPAVSTVQKLAFSAINAVFEQTHLDNVAQASVLARELLPLLSHWWQGRTSAQSEMLNSLRDEILKTLYHIHLHLDSLTRDTDNDALLKDVEDLLEVLWAEYSRRDDRARLQLDDISLGAIASAEDIFAVDLMSLRRFHVDGERRWALVEILAILEAIHMRNLKHATHSEDGRDDEEHPRKKRRTVKDISRIHYKLRSADDATCLTALHTIPFLAHHTGLSFADLSDILTDLMPLIGHKDAVVSSWAMIACASCSLLSKGAHESLSATWRQAWQIGVRSISLPGTSRAASLLLHGILKFRLVEYHLVSEDINSMVTVADISGPAILTDSSLSFMLHLLHLRNSKLPGASQSTCHYLIRWLFSRWRPVDLTFASLHSVHASPLHIVHLLGACSGIQQLPLLESSRSTGGSISITRRSSRDVEAITRYLLLLPDITRHERRSLAHTDSHDSSIITDISDAANFNAANNLIIELLTPKLEELSLVSESWNRRAGDAGSHITAERLQSLLSTGIVATIMLQQVEKTNSRQSRELEPILLRVIENALKAVLDSGQNQPLLEVVLRSVASYLPPLNTAALRMMHDEYPLLLRVLSKVAGALDERSTRQASGQHHDILDLDEEFDTQTSQVSTVSSTTFSLPRQDVPLDLSGDAFCLDVNLRLHLLAIIQDDESQVGLLPQTFVNQLLALSHDEFLCCRNLMRDLFFSDLVKNPDDVQRLVDRIGEILSDDHYTFCEIVLCTCIDMLDAFVAIWSNDEQEISTKVGDLYTYFVKTGLPNNSLSSKAQVWLSRLLLRLLKVNPDYGRSLGLSSCRSTLLNIMTRGDMFVKHSIGSNIPEIFSLYVLKTHDDIFLDVLQSLPADGGNLEEIAFRLFALGELACRWPTLLRRCTYHIFETSADLPESASYAAQCLKRVSSALSLDSTQDIFKLFAPQLLFTWLRLEKDTLEDIPFTIFGYSSLDELLRQSQTETIALMMMLGQTDTAEDLAKRLAIKLDDLIRGSFSKIMAYCVAWDMSSKHPQDYVTGEARLKKQLGREPFLHCIYDHFADILMVFFERVDQEDPKDKAFRDPAFAYAAKNMKEIREFGHSSVELPANQQPSFEVKHLTREIQYLCRRTEFEPSTLWTPAMVVCITRNLLNTIHPAFGSLHACAVLRKIRLLMCLADEQALGMYPLEMLLHSIRPFITDSECADDAMGMSRWLIMRGSSHLERAPSFLAGYSLSTLASLRVFLESSQASTTQESQFKATMSKAQQFHSWFAKYLGNYDSTDFRHDSQRNTFKVITQSASHIRASGNAEKGTHESNLLLGILRDREDASPLLNDTSRELTLGMLCNDFQVPVSGRTDIVETDADALLLGPAVWRSCRAELLSDNYLSWAGRAIGRSFAASGRLHEDLLRESRLSHYRTIQDGTGEGSSDSEQALLKLMQTLVVNRDCFTAGLAESALRTVISEADAEDNRELLFSGQTSVPPSLLESSKWARYQTPPSDTPLTKASPGPCVFSAEQLDKPTWSQDLSFFLAMSTSNDIILSVLPPMLVNVKGFAEQAFPFILHLVLLSQLNQQQTVKRQLSEAMRIWLDNTSPLASDNIKLLINAVLYLRTQKLPNEASIADRARWLDVEHAQAASAATRCGMHKTALLFAELAFSEVSRTARRSSVARDLENTDILQNIFENIDDPDAYYGLPQDASLDNVVSRIEYERDGAKSLAFRGAQYDSHIRQRNTAAEDDGRSLVKALSSLGLAGLSHSLLQTQNNVDNTAASLDNTFSTARRLEIWNLPTPAGLDSPAITLYKAYQGVYQATEFPAVQHAVNDSLGRTMRLVTSQSLTASSLRHHLGSLAVLSEMGDVLDATDAEARDNLFRKFEARSTWMMSGRYDDIRHILSCRESTMSMVSKTDRLRGFASLTPGEARLLEIKGMLLSSDIYRFHQATQESLNISTFLADLIQPCNELGLAVDAAVRMETANSLWDHGEMISSIRMLQSIDKDSSLKNQNVQVVRSDLLSKIGHQVSVARLEKPDSIQKNYLEPALKELRGKVEGKDAGQVFHQFAMFCDEQLQNPDGLEDLARLQHLKKGKSDEVVQLKGLMNNTRDSQLRAKYQSHMSKAKQWLALDEQELRRVEDTRTEFVKLSLENYLLSLIASDEHNNDALRFTALWLERSGEDTTNEAVRKNLDKVPTRKFAPLMNQLSSRLQEQRTTFQKLLTNLVYSICCDHPYHGMYQIWSGTKSRTNPKDEVAVLRHKATEKVARGLAANKDVGTVWQAIHKTSSHYHALAVERDQKYKQGQKVALRDSPGASSLVAYLAKYPIPPPTLQIELSTSKDYSDIPIITMLEPTMTIASGVSAPKIITAVGSNGKKYRQLVKGGNDDLRQDAIMEQVFAAVSSLLKLHRTTQQRNLGIRTYKVLPLTLTSGLIEFVPDTIPLHEYLMPAHEKYHPKDLRGSQCRKEISNVQSKSVETRISTYRKVTERFHPVMRYFFMEYFNDPDEWFARRNAYTRSTAAISMLGHVLGLGDRHGHNILLDKKTGESVHIDLGVAFEMGRILPVPELVPFRLTRDIVDGMGISKTEGVFRRCCEFTLDALREETYSIMTILDVLRYDPLYSWSISPVRLAKLQDTRRTTEDGDDAGGVGDTENRKAANEPSEADRALEVVRKKLSKTLSVTATVNDLINQATDDRNLAVLYSGWAAYA